MTEIEKSKRSVRSFVCRAGRMTERQRQALELQWPTFGIKDTDNHVSFKDLFQRTAPTILEIGFGMGASLSTLASQNQDINYIGIEVHKPGVGALLADISEKNITNIRIFCGDAIEILEKNIPDNSLAGVLLFFPDPWPKKRHHKRRIVQSQFVNLIYQKLASEGIFHLATDIEDYALHMLKVVESDSRFHNVLRDKGFGTGEKLRPKTKFELRGEKLGHSIWDLVFIK